MPARKLSPPSGDAEVLEAYKKQWLGDVKAKVAARLRTHLKHVLDRCLPPAEVTEHLVHQEQILAEEFLSLGAFDADAAEVDRKERKAEGQRKRRAAATAEKNAAAGGAKRHQGVEDQMACEAKDSGGGGPAQGPSICAPGRG